MELFYFAGADFCWRGFAITSVWKIFIR